MLVSKQINERRRSLCYILIHVVSCSGEHWCLKFVCNRITIKGYNFGLFPISAMICSNPSNNCWIILLKKHMGEKETKPKHHQNQVMIFLNMEWFHYECYKHTPIFFVPSLTFTFSDICKVFLFIFVMVVTVQPHSTFEEMIEWIFLHPFYKFCF